MALKPKIHLFVCFALLCVIGAFLLYFLRGDLSKESLEVSEDSSLTSENEPFTASSNASPKEDSPGPGILPTPSTGSLAASGKTGPLVPRPSPNASLEEILDYKKQILAGGIPDHPQASKYQPATPAFELDAGGTPRRLHAALNEVFIPSYENGPEIVAVPAAPTLDAWQAAASALSPQAEIVLYDPEFPRDETQAFILGSTSFLVAADEEEARQFAASHNCSVEAVEGEADGGTATRFLMRAPSASDNLRLILQNKITQAAGLRLEGNFRKVLLPRQTRAQTSRLSPRLTPRFIPNDTNFASQWHLLQTNNPATGGIASGVDLNVTPVWEAFKGNGILIGIVDDGLQIAHPDLRPNVSTNDVHYDWNDSTPKDPTPGALHPHGTAVAGLAAARGNNQIGVSGVAPEAQLAGLRLIASVPLERDESAAFRHAMNLIHIKNNSWGPSDDGTTVLMLSDVLQSALREATSNGRGGKGTVFIWSNGNGGLINQAQFVTDSSNYDGYANSIYAIAVTSLAANGQAPRYTEKGGNIAVAAPSSGPPASGLTSTPAITTTDLMGPVGYSATDYTSGFGETSAAAPMVAGVVALMLQANPDLGWRDVKEILIRTARPTDTTDAGWISNGANFRFNPWYGAGLVDAEEAVSLARDWENLDAMRSATTAKTGLNLLIPDNNAQGVTVDLPIAEDFRVESVAVKVSAKHAYRGDMVFSVISPAGTLVRLTGGVRYRDSRNDLTDVTFTTPYLLGEKSRGTWKVRAADEWIVLDGRLNAVTLTVYGSDSPVAPGNDRFERAFLLDGGSASISTSNRGAGREKGEPLHLGVRGGGSLWWKLQPRASGYLTMDTRGSGVDTLMALYQGTTLEGLTEIDGNDDIVPATLRQSEVRRFPIEFGQDYMLAIDGKNRARGPIRLNLGFTPGALFDHFADARRVSGTAWSDRRSNSGYSAEIPDEPGHAGGGAARSVWYRWTSTVGGTAVVDTLGSALDTRLAVYQGNSLKTLRLVAANDNDAGRKTSKVSFGLRAGDAYLIAVDGKNGATGSFNLNAKLASASIAPSPTNDPFASPLILSGDPASATGSNLNATRQTGESSGVQTSVWYQWKAPRSGVVTASTQGSFFDTTLAAFTGSSLAALQEVPSYPNAQLPASNDNALPGQRWSRIQFLAASGNTYYLRLDGARGATGQYVLRVSY